MMLRVARLSIIGHVAPVIANKGHRHLMHISQVLKCYEKLNLRHWSSALPRIRANEPDSLLRNICPGFE